MTNTLTKRVPVADVLPLHTDRKNRTTKRYFEHEAMLVRDIDKVGIRTPLKVIPEGAKWRLISGMTRFLAALRVGLTEVPVQVLDGDMTPTRLLLEELADNNLTEGFDLLAQADIYLELMRQQQWSQLELCANVPFAKPATVSKALAIFATLHDELKRLLRAGELGPRLAYALARLPADQQLTAWENVRAMKVERAEVYLASSNKAKPKRTPPPVKLQLPGLNVVFTVADATQAKSLLEQVAVALAKLVKHDLPLPNLPGLLHDKTLTVSHHTP